MAMSPRALVATLVPYRHICTFDLSSKSRSGPPLHVPCAALPSHSQSSQIKCNTARMTMVVGASRGDSLLLGMGSSVRHLDMEADWECLVHVKCISGYSGSAPAITLPAGVMRAPRRATA